MLSRFFHSSGNSWFSDNARDYLVVKNIVEHGDFHWIAPFAEGGLSYLVNSVFYYYFLSIFYALSFGDSSTYRFIFTLFFSFFLLLYSHLFYKLLFKEKAFYYAVILFFCSYPILYVFSTFVFQPNFALPFFLASTYHFLFSYQQMSIKHLSFAAALYLLALNLHLSFLSILPWIIGMTAYLQYRIYNDSGKSFKITSFIRSQFGYPVIILLFGFSFLIANQILVVNSNLASTFFIEHSFSKFIEIFFTNVFSTINLNNNLFIFFSPFIGSSEFNSVGAIFFFYTLILTFLIFVFGKKSFYSLSLFISLISYFPVFFIIKNLESHQLFYFFPGYILLLVFLVSVIATMNKKLRIFIIMLFFINFFQLIKPMERIRSSKNNSEFNKYEFAANAISNDLLQNPIIENNFYVYTVDDTINFSTPVYWLYLEKKLNVRLVRNGAFDRYNIFPIHEKSSYAYLICDRPDVGYEEDKIAAKWCIERFTHKDLLYEYKLVSHIESEEFSIYRIYLKQTTGVYNLSMP
jgi:hypothetical protein